MDEQLSELEKLQQAAQLIEEMSQGRLQVCPSVVGQVYIRPQHDSNLGMDMRIDSIPGQPHYRITFTVQLRRMGTDMVADDLRALLSEVGQTYAYLDTMSRWLENHGMPAITRVWYTEKNGQRLTLEQECLRSGTLPSIAYGYKKCSLKHKVAPQEKFCRHYQPCIDAWEKGEKVVKFIGYDAGEERRLLNALPHDLQDKKYQKEYPLMEWGWSRKDCIQAIRDAGLPLPGKSSCFFCPSMKRWEIRTLYHRYPDLLRRALAIEDAAMPNLTSVRGLGRNWAWRDFICADENQLAIPGAFSDEDLPCSCCMKGELPTADL